MHGAGTIKQGLLRAVPRSLQRRAKAWYYPRMLRRFTEDRWPETPIVRRLVSPGDHVVDAGANIGYISLLLSRLVGPEGRVHAFEPVPATFELLASNLRALGLKNVEARPVGVSDAASDVFMQTPDYAGGGENLYESHIVSEPGAGFAVRVVPLDEALGTAGGRVTFVKIDVEGHELAAIRGARQLLRAVQPALLIEVSGNPDEPGAAATLFAELKDLGYAPFRRSGLTLVPRVAGDREVDYYFLTASAARRAGAGEPSR